MTIRLRSLSDAEMLEIRRLAQARAASAGGPVPRAT